ncbi:hypothetical protein D3C76_1055230 [compost metagenome]
MPFVHLLSRFGIVRHIPVINMHFTLVETPEVMLINPVLQCAPAKDNESDAFIRHQVWQCCIGLI